MFRGRNGLFAALIVSGWSHVAIAAPFDSTDDLFALSLDELSQLKVTSVSRRPEELRYAPSAVYVITAEDLRRSGASSVAQALRMVPGMNVSRVGGQQWSISARGFDGVYPNKLLVLIDGRSVYSPFFGAVSWNVQDTALEDIERIEVIRGPGSVMWGANAVNGVVNIITRSAQETLGTLVSTSVGTEDRGIVTARQGVRWHNGNAGRAYIKASDRDGQERVGLGRGDDQADMLRVGFRIDSDPLNDSRYTFQGDVYGMDKGFYATSPSPVGPNYFTEFDDPSAFDSGANLLGRWQRGNAADGQFSVQMFYDNESRQVRDYFDSVLQTADIEMQYVPRVNGRHSWIFGGGARYIEDRLGSGALILNTDDADYTQASAFFQYGYAVIEDMLDVTMGSKFQYNEFADVEALPSVRALWRPQPQRSVWGAISRAVRSPSRVDQQMNIMIAAVPPGNPPPFPTLVKRLGNEDYESEIVMAYELGFREQFSDTLSVDIATFYNRYEGGSAQVLQGAPVVIAGPPQYLQVTVQPENDGLVDTYTWGGEAVVDWQVAKHWQLQAWYSFLRRVDTFSSNPDMFGPTPGSRVEEDRDQASLRSYFNRGRLELDSRLRYVDANHAINVDQYTELDVRVGWRLDPHVRLSLVLANALHDGHMEGRTPPALGVTDAEVERAASIGIEWRAAGFD